MGSSDNQKNNFCTKIRMKAQTFVNSAIVKEPFRVVTITLLSLLIPLSFLLLARLSCARFLLTLAHNNNKNQYYYNNNNYYYSSNNKYDYFSSTFLYTNPALLYFIVSLISVSTLIHSLTGNLITTLLTIGQQNRKSISLYASWIFLCLLQVSVGLGIEGSVRFGGLDYFASSLGFYNNNKARTLFSRVIFFLGLHETMLHWCRLVVRPVVDDTVLGGAAERWARKGALAGGFGSLWYWRVRDEVESMVVVAEVKGEMLMEVDLGDFVGWWLYYLTVTVGLVRVVKAVLWVVMSLFSRRLFLFDRGGLVVYVNNNNHHHHHHHHDGGGGDDEEEKLVWMNSRNVDECC